ncbi:hypothetical protein COOONC_18177, partial [Cooperia oncophora]
MVLSVRTLPSISLAEEDPNAPVYLYFLRFFLGVVIILSCRVVLKFIAKLLIKGLYTVLDLKHYSYSEMCRDLGDLQPTKRYTNRMRFKPIPGAK